MRRSSFPFSFLVSSHVNTKFMALPICKNPLGVGAIRERIIVGVFGFLLVIYFELVLELFPFLRRGARGEIEFRALAQYVFVGLKPGIGYAYFIP